MEGDFRVGVRLVRPRLNAIEHDETTSHLEPKIMQVLVVLATHAGDVVTRQQLLEMVWRDVYVGEDVLIRAISELRRAFQDDPRTQHTIQTVPKVGYRLVAPAEAVEQSPREPADSRDEPVENAEVLPEIVESVRPSETKRRVPWTRMPVMVLAGGAFVLLLMASYWLWNRTSRRAKTDANPTASGDSVPASVAAGAAGECPISPGATYEIENERTGSVLEVPSASAINGTLLNQWKGHRGGNQLWVADANGPYWTFTNVASGKLLDDPGSSRAVGIQLDQWQANHAPNQNWILLPAGDKSCKIVSQVSGLLLDVDQGSAADGTAVIQYPDNDGANQHWIFRLVKKAGETR